MRKLFLGALVGVLTLAMAAVAMAASEQSGNTVQNYDQSYSSKKTKTSVGTTFGTSSTDETNPRNKQPKRVTNFDITFPRSSKINNKAIPQCKADQNDFANAPDPDDACPKGSKIGTGEVAARTPFNGVADFTGEVFAYNANKGLLLFVNITTANQTLLLKPKFRGLKLLTSVPHTCIPPNTPQNDCKDAQGVSQEAILTNFELKTKAMSKGKGRKKKSLITSPSSCPKGSWPFQANIKYADGSRVTIKDTSACKKTK
jgi:hypothetical protein